jgi:PST family polysaccharide transporter
LCVAELGFARITVRDLVKDPADEERTLGATFYTRLFVGTIMLVMLGLVSLGLPENERLLLLAYGLLLPTHGFAELGSWLEARGQVKRAAWAQFWAFVAGALLITVGVAMKAPPIVFALAYVLECWLSSFFMMGLFHSMGGHMSRWWWSSKRAVALLRESWPEMVAQMALVLLYRIDVIMVKAMRGDAEAGVYGAAVRVSEVLYFVPVALASVVLPQLISLQSRDPKQYEKRFADYFGVSLVVSILGAIGLQIASGPIVSLLWGDGFKASTGILAIHAWAFIPYCLGVARTQYLAAESKLWANLPSVLLALVTNIVLNWFWIPRWSGEGAAWATLVSYTVAWIFTSFLLPGVRPVAMLKIRSLFQLPHLLVELVHRAWSQWNSTKASTDPLPPS